MILGIILFEDGGFRLFFVVAALLVGVVLASRRSTYMVDYYMLIVCTNRLFRRVMDWRDGAYDTQPLSSLVAPTLCCMMLAVVLTRPQLLSPTARKAGMYIAAGLAYAMILGAGNRMAAFFALLEYLMPVGLMFYVLTLQVTAEIYDRWLRSLGALAVAVAVYGVYQWAFMPPWDAAWVNWSEMWTSMGAPIPYKMSICSTLESRGPFAWFMGLAAVPMCVDKKCRRPFGVAGLVLVVFGVILSTARSALGFVVLGVVSYSVFSKGKNLTRLAVSFAVISVVLAYVLPKLPEHQRLVKRMETLRNISDDGSFQGRVAIADRGIRIVLTHPQGYGLGATGVGADKLRGTAVSGDNGYISLLIDFGIPGFFLFSSGMWLVGKQCLTLQRKLRSRYQTLPLALLTAGLVFLMIGNWVSGPYGALIFMLLAGAVRMQPVAATSRPRATSVAAKTMPVKAGGPYPSVGRRYP